MEKFSLSLWVHFLIVFSPFTDVRLRKFGEEKNDLEDQVRRLKLELEEERSKNRRRENGLDYEKQSEWHGGLGDPHACCGTVGPRYDTTIMYLPLVT